LQLRQLDLQLAFAALRTLREDVQDERGTIEHPKSERLLKIALLSRGQRDIEDDQAGIRGSGLCLQFFNLARANEMRRVRPITPDAEQCRRHDVG